MKLSFLTKIFAESNVHGIGLVFRPRNHMLERIFWISLLCTSFYFASTVCRKELRRYQHNSVVLSLETNWRNWEYLVPAVTICTDYFDDERANNFIEAYKHWNLRRNDSNFEIFKTFVQVVATTTYRNLQNFRQFSNYTFLRGLDLDMLQIAKEMREDLLPDSGYNLVVTEMGVCFSSTYLYSLQSVSERIHSTSSPHGDYCRATLSPESCVITFIHNKDDVLNPTNAIAYNFSAKTTTTIELVIFAVVHSNKLKQLSPAQRRCYFPSELPLKYFNNIYTRNLCLISCRIDAAIKYCDCIPFFYDSTNVPVCDILGMVCLSDIWYSNIFNASELYKTCNCLPLCSNIVYTTATIEDRFYIDFEPSIELTIKVLKKRVKRGVVYSADSLLASFGGAFGFYLGCGVISIVEFVFFIVEFCVEQLMSLWSIIRARK